MYICIYPFHLNGNSHMNDLHNYLYFMYLCKKINIFIS